LCELSEASAAAVTLVFTLLTVALNLDKGEHCHARHKYRKTNVKPS